MKETRHFITAIICTYNRSESLRNTLDSLLNQDCNGRFSYEVIIVDNNSNDETKDVIESFMPKFNHRLKYLFEPKQGKSYALNSGIKNANGDIIVFTDDDVIPDKHWLFNINNAFDVYNCDGLGGKILPHWKIQPPGWLTKRYWHQLALLDYGEKPFFVSLNGFLFYGANVAFKKELFLNGGGYNVDLGPLGKKLTRGEDEEIHKRFLKKGYKLLYYPQAIVYHTIEINRISKQYFKKWNFYAAQSSFFMKNSYSLRKTLWELLDRIISYIWCSLKQDKENSLYHEIKLFSHFGRLKAKLKHLMNILT